MIAKPERRSISWWLFIMITSVVSASFFTVFTYYVYATCNTSSGLASCSKDQGCGVVDPDCFNAWTITAKVTNTIYPCQAGDPCTISSTSDHSVYVSNSCAQGRGIKWWYGSCITNITCGIQSCTQPEGTATVPGNSSFSNTYSVSPPNVNNPGNGCKYEATAYTHLVSTEPGPGVGAGADTPTARTDPFITNCP